MYKVPRRFKAPISFARWSWGIETEKSFQDKVQKRFVSYCIITLFSGFIIGGVAGQITGPINNFPYAPVTLMTSAPISAGQESMSVSAESLLVADAIPHESMVRRAMKEALPGLRHTITEPKSVALKPVFPDTDANGLIPGSVKHKPRIAIVIDDLGVALEATEKMITLPAPLTMAFLPYGVATPSASQTAKERGHELILHLPMEPDGPKDAGPHVLKVSSSRQELQEDLLWNFEQFDHYAGVNNHMGSRFTPNADAMNRVMSEVKLRDLFFLDSLTHPQSQGKATARAHGVPFLTRDIFLDHDPNTLSIRAQLQKLEEIAKERGYAIGIGHPYETTFDVLQEWLATAGDRGIDLVTLSTLLENNPASPSSLKVAARH